MVFEEGKKNKTFYNTPYGTLQMGISATGLELKESEDGIQMKVDYALDMNEEHVADCYLTVQAQSKDSADFVYKIQIKARKAEILYGHCLSILFVFAEHSFEKSLFLRCRCFKRTTDSFNSNDV